MYLHISPQDIRNLYQVDYAVDAKMAFEMIEQKKYDVVLMDIRMPHMSGWIRGCNETSGIRQ